MGFFVTFWGVRGSIPTPGPATSGFGGNTACVQVEIDGQLFICDAGSGLRELGMDLMAEHRGPITAHLLFSHMHWDHIQGFPFFAPAYVPSNTFHIYDQRPDEATFHRLLSGQMKSHYFPVKFDDLRGNIHKADLAGGERDIGGVRVRSMRQEHPGGSWAYSFEKDGVKLVYATDNELDLRLPNADEVRRRPRDMRQIPDEFVRFCEGASLLIADAQYTDREYPEVVGWGHSRASTATDLAILAKAERLALFHHDPTHSDDDIKRMQASCRARVMRFRSDVTVFAAREGFELRLDDGGEQVG